MQITIHKSNQLKAIAILMMLCLHLFNRDYNGLFTPLFFVGKQPLTYHISLFSDACLPIFAFISGFGLYYKYKQDKEFYGLSIKHRIKKIYINYWIIVVLFAVVLGWVLEKEGYPGSFVKFILNFLALDNSYNGAWCFLTIYLLFVISSRFWFSLLDRLNPIFYVGILLVLYCIAFYFRIYKTNVFDYAILQWLHRYMALYFCTLFQFMLGAMALEYQWAEKIRPLFHKIHFNNFLGLGLIILLIVFHGIIPNFIIAPFTGLAFILIYVYLKTPIIVDRFLAFLNPHSTNMWLIHMFFYLIYFPKLIYGFKYPILFFSVLVSMCIFSSYIVNIIQDKIHKWL